MKKLIAAFALLLILVVAIPLVARLFPALRNNPAWNVIMTVWGCLLGILFLIVTFASLFNQMCPAAVNLLARIFGQLVTVSIVEQNYEMIEHSVRVSSGALKLSPSLHTKQL